MAFSLRRYVYETYARGGAASWPRRLHRQWFCSPHTTRWLFGMEVLPLSQGTYYDLTTILLKEVLAEEVRRRPDMKMLEIGVGRCAVLSGSLSRLATRPMDATDIRDECVELSRRHVALNGVRVNVFQSDLFTNVPARDYDLIFWNLPYYEDPGVYLAGLLREAAEHMSEEGRLVLGYNTKALPRATVLRLLAASPLRLARTCTWWWNLHDVLVLEKR